MLVTPGGGGDTAFDRSLVDQAVRDLNALYAEASIEVARVGNYVVERFFGGDLASLDEARKQNPIFAALAEREDLKFSKSFLWSAERLLPQLAALPGEVGARLPLSHHHLLLHVKEEKVKERLAR